MNRQKSQTKTKVWIVEPGSVRVWKDKLTTEDPLEIRLVSPKQTVAVTMRTPRADFDLAGGFLYNEGVITCREDIRQMSYCVDEKIDG